MKKIWILSSGLILLLLLIEFIVTPNNYKTYTLTEREQEMITAAKETYPDAIELTGKTYYVLYTDEGHYLVGVGDKYAASKALKTYLKNR